MDNTVGTLNVLTYKKILWEEKTITHVRTRYTQTHAHKRKSMYTYVNVKGIKERLLPN